ncbi:MAG: carboxypeptidase-like regulatory domain-containing protein [Bryobacteraceae bacterium]
MRSLIAGILFAGLAALPAAADDTTRIRVEVRSLQGKPIDRASVRVQFVEGRSIIKLGKKIIKSWELRTNQDGVAKIPELPQGKMLVQVYAKGYQTYGETIDVNEEKKTIEVKLKPPQPQYSAH